MRGIIGWLVGFIGVTLTPPALAGDLGFLIGWILACITYYVIFVVMD